MSDNPEAQERAAFEAWFSGEQGKPYYDMWAFARAAWNARAALAQQAATPKDHEIAAAVNALLVVVGEFHGHDSLRERLARIAVPLMKRAARQAATPPSESADAEALPEPEGWLYDWTHSSALGRPDEHFTGFSKDRAYANDKSKSHENPRRVYTADQMRAAIAAARQAATPTDAVAAFEEAMRQAWRMIDPLHPAGQPGSYARGQDAGIAAALKTVHENFERLVARQAATPALPLTNEQIDRWAAEQAREMPRPGWFTLSIPMLRAIIGQAWKAATPAPAEPVYQLRAPLSEGDGWSNWYEADKEAFDRYRNDPAYKARVLYAAPPATPAPADEREAFEAWFSGEQGKPYYDMWAFAWAVWQARAALEGQG